MHLTPLIDAALSWRTLLDIALISLAIFFLLRTLARLGTWKIGAGLFLALGVFIAANLLHLQGIEWVYNNVSQVALIGLVILFQPELRKVLERAAWAPPPSRTKDDEQLSRLVADSLLAMAGQSCGALIVYPGREPLGDKLSGGFDLNAIPSYPLILSIFDDSSPGHDGAVIIRNGRLARFGARLPMSSTTRLSDSFGTRHHAAMGLAEQSDALALVVSEERGEVSAFREGQMLRLESAREIHRTILHHLEATGQRRSGRRRLRFPKTHIVFALLSVAAAAAFSLSVLDTSRNVVERSVAATIDYSSSAGDGSVLVGDKATEVVLHLSGPITEMDSLRRNPPHVVIDLGTLEAGKHEVVITEDNLDLPRKLRLLDVSPAQLELTLAPMERRNMPITPQLIGKLPHGLRLKNMTLTPDSVFVTMPKVKEDEEDHFRILTTPIYLDSIRADSRIFCGVVARPSIRPADGTWPDVEVRVHVEESGSAPSSQPQPQTIQPNQRIPHLKEGSKLEGPGPADPDS